MRKKILWSLIILISILLCVANIVLSCYFPNDGANIFTTISGWLSGIATIILGIITIWQSKKYTLATMKLELKNNINNEKEKFLSVCNELTKFTKYIQPLENLISPKLSSKQKLTYKWLIDDIYEQAFIEARNIQLYPYISENMEDVVKSIINFTSSLKEDYLNAEKLSNDDVKLTKKFRLIFSRIRQWIIDFSKIRNKTIQELTDFSNKIDNCKSIGELERLLKNRNGETQKSQTNISKELDKMITTQNIKEKNNGKDEDAE